MGKIKKLQIAENFELYSGQKIPQVQLAYQCWGKLNKQKNNVILICHALTGNSGVADFYDRQNNFQHGWWHEIVGKGKVVDTDKYYVICSNVLGSCYGSSGPTTKNPYTNKPYNMTFPIITVRDMVKAQKKLLTLLGIKKLYAIIGPSLGGMQALEWGIIYPNIMKKIIVIAACAKHSAWGIGFNEIARQAIMNDPDWQEGNYNYQPKKGLALARMSAMLTYRSHESLEKRFGREKQNLASVFNFGNTPDFQIESYLNYQGEKLVNRFDANSYLYITKAIDLHDITADRGALPEVLAGIKAKTLTIGVSSDILYPTDEQKILAKYIPHCQYKEIKSVHGHDGFLIEQLQLTAILETWL